MQHKFVKKGPSRPFFNQNIRSEMVASLDMVDYVVLSNSENAVNVISKLKPNFYVKGQDYKNFKSDITKNILKEKKAVEKNRRSGTFWDVLGPFGDLRDIVGHLQRLSETCGEYLTCGGTNG